MRITPTAGAATAAQRTRWNRDALAASRAASAEGSGESLAVVDLVIAIGTDAPMLSVAQALDDVLDASVDAATEHCASSLRVTCLGIGGYFGATRFGTSASDYLAPYVADPSALQETPLPPGDLACAVVDLSKYFDWLPAAHRAILLAGDISLIPRTGGNIDTMDAVAAARAADVKVYTCAVLSSDSEISPNPVSGTAAPGRDSADEGQARTVFVSPLTGKDIADYLRLAQESAGAAFICVRAATDFPVMLREVICDAAASGRTERPDRSGNVAGSTSCCCDCEQAYLIVRTASMLSNVLRRVADHCYPEKSKTY